MWLFVVRVLAYAVASVTAKLCLNGQLLDFVYKTATKKTLRKK